MFKEKMTSSSEFRMNKFKEREEGLISTKLFSMLLTGTSWESVPWFNSSVCEGIVTVEKHFN